MTSLYAQFTASTVAEVAQHKENRRPRGRSLPQPPDSILPWKMEELPGTTWRNVHTYTATTVHDLKENRDGKLGPDPDVWINAMFSIGLWRGDQFCIEHWVRVDHLPAQVQVEWAIERVAYCRRQLLHSRSRHQRHKLEYDQHDLHQARSQLEALATQLHVTLTAHLANIGAQPNEQLALL